VTYVDTITFIVIIAGSSLAVALLFAATVLSFKWWKMILIHRHHRNKKDQQKKQDSNNKLIPQYKVVEVKSQSQKLVQLKRMSNWNELINKKVKTCEMVDVGRIIAIDKQSMTVLHESKQKYVIPTYYIREYNQENVVIDISIRYLYHYKPEQELHSSYIQKESIHSKGQQQQSQLELSMSHASKSSITKSKPHHQTVTQFTQSSDWSKLLNKRVITSGKGDIGYVYMIDEEFTTVLQGIKQQYIIPTSCIKEYDEENVFIDISRKSLDSCKVKTKL
jgi:hypothetical protein